MDTKLITGNSCPGPEVITIRPAAAEDANGIACTYLESAEYHASLDPDRYSVPAFDAIAARYCEGRHPADAGEEALTLVGGIGG